MLLLFLNQDNDRPQKQKRLFRNVIPVSQHHSWAHGTNTVPCISDIPTIPMGVCTLYRCSWTGTTWAQYKYNYLLLNKANNIASTAGAGHDDMREAPGINGHNLCASYFQTVKKVVKIWKSCHLIPLLKADLLVRIANNAPCQTICCRALQKCKHRMFLKATVLLQMCNNKRWKYSIFGNNIMICLVLTFG